jgi:hypothetical protein
MLYPYAETVHAGPGPATHRSLDALATEDRDQPHDAVQKPSDAETLDGALIGG